MGPIAQVIEQRVALEVLEEAINEVRGRSTKKWGLALVALAAGGVIVYFMLRRRRDDSAPTADFAATR